MTIEQRLNRFKNDQSQNWTRRSCISHHLYWKYEKEEKIRSLNYRQGFAPESSILAILILENLISVYFRRVISRNSISPVITGRIEPNRKCNRSCLVVFLRSCSIWKIMYFLTINILAPNISNWTICTLYSWISVRYLL